MEPGELAKLLEELRQKDPTGAYRHIMGLIRELVEKPSPKEAKKKEEKEFLRSFNL